MVFEIDRQVLATSLFLPDLTNLVDHAFERRRVSNPLERRLGETLGSGRRRGSTRGDGLLEEPGGRSQGGEFGGVRVGVARVRGRDGPSRLRVAALGLVHLCREPTTFPSFRGRLGVDFFAQEGFPERDSVDRLVDVRDRDPRPFREAKLRLLERGIVQQPRRQPLLLVPLFRAQFEFLSGFRAESAGTGIAAVLALTEVQVDGIVCEFEQRFDSFRDGVVDAFADQIGVDDRRGRSCGGCGGGRPIEYALRE